MLPVKAFVDFAELNDLFGRDSNILAAVSGGMDSVLMVHLLKLSGYKFGIAHCNFRLRAGESDGDEEFCKSLAQKFDVPFYTRSFDTAAYAAGRKISIQMAARELRYQWFQRVKDQSGYTAIALAHHQNDAIETILLNLVRGTGIVGLHGILPKNGPLVRPMLFLDRQEITKIVAENGIAYREDSSNTSVKYARNKLRLEIIPKLKKLNPALEQTFQHNLENIREMGQLLDQVVMRLRKELFVPNGDDIHIPLAGVQSLEPKKLLLFNLLQPFGFNETTVNDLIAALYKHPGRSFESPGYILVLDRVRLILSKKNDPQRSELLITAELVKADYGAYKLTILHDNRPLIIKNNPMAVSVNAGKLLYPLTLRPWQHGDVFYPLGMRGKKKLSDFFTGQKISLHDKEDVPLLVNGNGELIWVGGYRPDERYKVTENTEKVTIFELFKIK